MVEKLSVIKNKFIALISIAVVLLLIVMMLIYIFYYRNRIGPEQPIHFSHRVHVNDKQISCVLCHEGAIRTKLADIPPLQTCMLCHDRIITNHQEIRNLRNHYFNNEPVEWVRAIDKVPDFVFFNHSIHIFRQIDCSECHGNIREMDRVKQVKDFEMGMCMKCHREKGASLDCYACHR